MANIYRLFDKAMLVNSIKNKRSEQFFNILKCDFDIWVAYAWQRPKGTRKQNLKMFEIMFVFLLLVVVSQFESI